MSHSGRSIAIAGAGISGATLARQLAEAGFHCDVFEERNHVAGNCHTVRDEESGILVHRYGPHIFHTDDDIVWHFMNRFADFVPYRHQVLTITMGRVFSLPINLLTINQFYGKCFSPTEAQAFLASRAVDIPNPRNFEEQALATIGPELYLAFFKGYTEKQWGRPATQLPATTLKRLPVRFTYDANYFHHVRQALPRNGYSETVGAMLSHENITLHLDCSFSKSQMKDHAHTFYTGMLDGFFGFSLGRLPYRTLKFEEMRDSHEQGTAVMNYPDADVPWTRITDHKYLSPWETRSGSLRYREYSRDAGAGDIPFYPVHTDACRTLLHEYVALAEAEEGVTFLGRLGNFAYLDMDVAIARALEVARNAIPLLLGRAPLPAFFHRPL